MPYTSEIVVLTLTNDKSQWYMSFMSKLQSFPTPTTRRTAGCRKPNPISHKCNKINWVSFVEATYVSYIYIRRETNPNYFNADLSTFSFFYFC